MAQEHIIIDAQLLISPLERNFGVIQAQVKGLTHEDSLLQLPFRGNCLNWIVGHITQSRNKMLDLVNEALVWTPEQIARYDRNSEPVTSGEDALHFEKILADLGTIHERLIAALTRMSPDELSATAKEVIKGTPPWSIAEYLNFLIWHETYHVGQTEILRQLSGVNDKVI
jgi:uncharacterized damage-inducible protein DinB